jgi:hypothetical protein
MDHNPVDAKRAAVKQVQAIHNALQRPSSLQPRLAQKQIRPTLLPLHDLPPKLGGPAEPY